MRPKPNAVWMPSPNFWPGRLGHQPIAIVCHVMDGTLAGTDAWFQNPQAKVSAHYGIGKDGSIHQYVREEDTAWANGIVKNPAWAVLTKFAGVNPNYYTLSIEHEGRSGEPLTEAQYQASLSLIRYLCDRWRIPPNRDHVIGHYRLDSVNRANCPGPAFPWDRLFADLAPPDPYAEVPDYARETARMLHERGVLQELRGGEDFWRVLTVCDRAGLFRVPALLPTAVGESPVLESKGGDIVESKKWYLSKTVWVNLISLVSVFLAAQFGFQLSQEETAAILTTINLILRAVTKQPLGL